MDDAVALSDALPELLAFADDEFVAFAALAADEAEVSAPASVEDEFESVVSAPASVEDEFESVVFRKTGVLGVGAGVGAGVRTVGAGVGAGVGPTSDIASLAMSSTVTS